MACQKDNFREPSLFYKEEDIRELIVCSICLQEYNEPKMLPCGHTFCQECIQGLVKNGNSKNLECPTCKKVHRIPLEGEFPPNLLTAQLVKKKPKRVNRSEIGEKISEYLEKINKEFQDLKSVQTRPTDTIKEHSSKLKNAIDLAMETVVFEAQCCRDEMFKIIDDYESECILRVEMMKENDINQVVEVEPFLEKWSAYLNEFKIEDEQLKGAMEEASALMDALREQGNFFFKTIFGEKQLVFQKNDLLSGSSCLGQLLLRETSRQPMEMEQSYRQIRIMDVLRRKNLTVKEEVSFEIVGKNKSLIAFLDEQGNLCAFVIDIWGSVLASSSRLVNYFVSSFKTCSSGELVYFATKPYGWEIKKCEVNIFNFRLELQNLKPLVIDNSIAIFADQKSFYYVDGGTFGRYPMHCFRFHYFDNLLKSKIGSQSCNLNFSASDRFFFKIIDNENLLCFFKDSELTKISLNDFGKTSDHKINFPTSTLSNQHGFIILYGDNQLHFYDKEVKLIKKEKLNTETSVQKALLTAENQLLFLDSTNMIIYVNP